MQCVVEMTRRCRAAATLWPRMQICLRSENVRKILVLFVGLRTFGESLRSLYNNIRLDKSFG